MVYGKRDSCQHILLSRLDFAQKSLRGFPEAVNAAAQKQEVVQIPLRGMEQHASDTVALHRPSICLEMQGIRIEIHEQAGTDVIRNTLLALRQLC